MNHHTPQTYSDTWYTPPEWLEWVEATIGKDYFDPCPRVHDPSRDGLTVQWSHANYVNHPGGRGNAKLWWSKLIQYMCSEMSFGDGWFNYKIAYPAVWCAFNIEQFRYLRPSPLELPGWLIQPRKRIAFIWGGETKGNRVHGQPCKSPANASAFWSTVEPAEPPHDSIILRTGVK